MSGSNVIYFLGVYRLFLIITHTGTWAQYLIKNLFHKRSVHIFHSIFIEFYSYFGYLSYQTKGSGLIQSQPHKSQQLSPDVSVWDISVQRQFSPKRLSPGWFSRGYFSPYATFEKPLSAIWKKIFRGIITLGEWLRYVSLWRAVDLVMLGWHSK